MQLLGHSQAGLRRHRSRSGPLIACVVITVSLLVLQVLSATPGPSCLPEEPCCFSDLYTEALSHDGAGVQQTAAAAGAAHQQRQQLLHYATPQWMAACLGSVRLEASAANATAEILKNAHSESYAHADVVRGSWRSIASGDPPVHKVEVDLTREIDRVLAESRLPPPPGRDGAPAKHHSAFAFHYGLSEAFLQLEDARTFYQTPFTDWTLRRVVGLWPTLDPSGRAVFILDAAPEWDLEGGWPDLYKAVHGEEPPDLTDLLGAVVTHVNGLPAEKYMRVRADSVATFVRSPGAKLNFLLNDNGQGQPLDLSPPPALDEEVFTFDGGSTATFKLTIMYSGTARDSADLESIYNEASAHGSISGWFESLAQRHEEVWREPLCRDHCEEESHGPSTANATAALQSLREWADAVSDANLKSEELLGGGVGPGGGQPGTCPGPDAHQGGGDGNWNAAAGGGEGNYEYQDELDAAEGDGLEGDEQLLRQPRWQGADAGAAEDEYYYYEDDYRGGAGAGGCGAGGGFGAEEDFQDLTEYSVEPGLLHLASFSDGLGLPFLGVYSFEGHVVLKIRDFQPLDGPWATPGALLRALYSAVGVAEAYARPRGIHRLLVDVLDNHNAAASTSAYFLLRLLQSDWTTPALLCDLSNLRVSPIGGFLSSEGAGSSFLLQKLAQVETRDLEDAAESLLRIVEAAQATVELMHAEWAETSAFDRVDLEIVKRGSQRLQELLLEDPVDLEGLRVELEGFVQEAAERLLLAAAGRSKGSVDGALKYDPGSGQELKGLEWYRLQQVQRRWGPSSAAASNYTQPFHSDECHQALQWFGEVASDPKKAVHGFKQVAIVTDGVCVGACSVFVTRMSLSGSAKVITVGGWPRGSSPAQGTDISGSTGGAADEWDVFSTDTTLAAAVSLMLGHVPCLPPPPPQQQQLQHQAGSAPSCGGFNVNRLPVPLPMAAAVHFALSNHLEPYLGAGALPREFYALQGDSHLHMWTRDPGVPPSKLEGDPGGIYWGILQVWTAAFGEFGSCPELRSWRNAPVWVEQDPVPDIMVEPVPFIGDIIHMAAM